MCLEIYFDADIKIFRKNLAGDKNIF